MNYPTVNVLFGAYNLLNNLMPHQHAPAVVIEVVNKCATLTSGNPDSPMVTTLPCAGDDVSGRFSTSHLLDALHAIPNQPITVSFPIHQDGVVHAFNGANEFVKFAV